MMMISCAVCSSYWLAVDVGCGFSPVLHHLQQAAGGWRGLAALVRVCVRGFRQAAVGIVCGLDYLRLPLQQGR